MVFPTNFNGKCCCFCFRCRAETIIDIPVTMAIVTPAAGRRAAHATATTTTIAATADVTLERCIAEATGAMTDVTGTAGVLM